MKGIHSPPQHRDWRVGVSRSWFTCLETRLRAVHYPVLYIIALWVNTNGLLFQLASASTQTDKDIQLDLSSQSQHAGEGGHEKNATARAGIFSLIFSVFCNGGLSLGMLKMPLVHSHSCFLTGKLLIFLLFPIIVCILFPLAGILLS